MNTGARRKPPLAFYEPRTIGEQPHHLVFVPGPSPAVGHVVGKKFRGGYSELIASAWLLEHGFEVFRNLCDRGPVDLIALKDERVELIDVKTVQIRVSKRGICKINEPQLSQQQTDMGVRALFVTPDGLCDWHIARLRDIYNEINREPRS
ncbi:hypothetical protein LCGC14_2562270 [marine sediment metagenome]|uniref:PD(D/E)XK endonuclease domain-containing protein n=1 Tax=marine sediment metagenome TaxID=412755 RepID=A0A0F9AKA6_9ZZZZ